MTQKLVRRILKNPSNTTEVSEFFNIESTAVSKKLEGSRWGDGYDYAVVGKSGVITITDLDNIWVTEFDSRFQSTVRNKSLIHFYKNGTAAVGSSKDEDENLGPIRLVQYNGKFYVHDGHHRMAAAILRQDAKVKVHIWKLRGVR